MDNIPLLRSFESSLLSQPPVDTGGYKYFTPTEFDAEGVPGKRERPLYPDRAMGRATFKKAAVEDGGGEQGRLL
jgi:hypothetical protein